MSCVRIKVNMMLALFLFELPTFIFVLSPLALNVATLKPRIGGCVIMIPLHDPPSASSTVPGFGPPCILDLFLGPQNVQPVKACTQGNCGIDTPPQ